MLHGTPGIVVYKAKLGGQNRSLHTPPGDYNNLYLMKFLAFYSDGSPNSFASMKELLMLAAVQNLSTLF